MSPELTEADAMNIVKEYYTKTFKSDETARQLLAIISSFPGSKYMNEITGLIIYAFNAGVLAERGER